MIQAITVINCLFLNDLSDKYVSRYKLSQVDEADIL